MVMTARGFGAREGLKPKRGWHVLSIVCMTGLWLCNPLYEKADQELHAFD